MAKNFYQGINQNPHPCKGCSKRTGYSRKLPGCPPACSRWLDWNAPNVSRPVKVDWAIQAWLKGGRV